MKKFHITIPKPCHENWNAMKPEEKGRFCGSCQKAVTDFTNMSDRELALFLKKPLGNLCGRFHADQLDRVFEVPVKRIPWLKYFFTIALQAFLFSLKSNAQREIMGKPMMQQEKLIGDTTFNHLKPLGTKNALKGRIITKPTGKLKIEKLSCETSLFPRAPLNIQLKEIKVMEEKSVVSEMLQGVMGMISVLPKKVAKKTEESPFILSKKADSAFEKFSVFPNPVASGSYFTIGTKELENGSYNLQVFTSAGEIVQSLEVVIDVKSKNIPVNLIPIASGPYFLRLTNKQSQKSYTEIIIVQ